MPYYRGDYLGQGQSNYSRGDPFLGALIGGAAKALGGKALKWAGKQLFGSPTRAAVTTAIGTSLIPTGAVPQAAPIQIGPVGINPGAMLPGGVPGLTFGPIRKKYRHMNPLNPKALKRALRRAESFEKFARRTVNALRSGPKKFKSTRRRSS